MSQLSPAVSPPTTPIAGSGAMKSSGSSGSLQSLPASSLASPKIAPGSSGGGSKFAGMFDRRSSQDLSAEADIPHVTQKLCDSNLPSRTKLICTLGPACASQSIMTKLVGAGMNVARFNFSHQDRKYHEQLLLTLREVLSETKRVVATLCETHGPEIRTGAVKDGKDINLEKGQKLILSPDYTVVGDKTRVGVSSINLFRHAKIGAEILLDYGLISLKVDAIDIKTSEVTCTVQNQAALGSNKKVHLPGVVLFNDLKSVITENDLTDIAFATQHNMDFIALSYVRNAEDVNALRAILAKSKSGMKIIAKIESSQAMENFDSILAAADGILISRGDLGVEIPIEQVSLAQKAIIRKCNAAGKPVITATQMLDSMIKNPSPTRAEASDVANAVLDGTDCVMLSGETAKGLWPVEATAVMADICREAEASTNYRVTFQMLKENVKGKISVSEAIASSAVKAAFDLSAALVIVLTESGTTARLVSKYRPNTHILAITSSEQSARQCLISRGLFPLLVSSMSGTQSLIRRAIVAAEHLKMCEKGDLVIITSGQKEGVSGNTNDLKIVQVQF